MTELDRILVVEDDPLVSEVIAAALGDVYPTTLAETAEAALTLLRSGGFRLMLLDCTLPGGMHTELPIEADRLGTAVILMSGDPDRVAQLSDRPRPFLQKPFTLGTLLDAVNAVLASTTSHPT
ncbi:MAG TPA: response regulator [Rhodopila sp.]|nr:response regulator [Rhodopila sp.]